jgi:general secretion pathway protein F
MKTFEYRGYDQAGRAAKGLIEAFDLKDAREKLAQKGVLTQKINAAGASGQTSRTAQRSLFDTGTRSLIYRELSALLKAGLPLDKSFDILIETPELGGNTALLAGVRDQVREGKSLADALVTAHPRVTAFEQALIEVGETTGNLPDSMDNLAHFLEEDQVVREKVQTAMIYPLIVITLALIALIILMAVMFPAFSKVLTEMKIDPPLVTRLVMGLGEFITQYGLIVFPCIIAAIWISVQRVRSSAAYKERLSRRLFTLPVVRKAYTALINLRFARTLSLMLKGGIPVTQSIRLAGKSTGNPWITGLAEAQAERVQHGANLADAISAIPPLSETLPGWIRAGEASGDLPGLLESAAHRYQRMWERTVARLLSLMEPVIILAIGIFVLLVALAVLMPLLSMNKAILGGG